MGVATNGKSGKGKKDAKAKPNGQANGHINATVDSSLDRRSRRSSRKSQQSYSAWGLSLTARLAVWYCIITAAFFCPQSHQSLDKTSPAICKPYLDIKSRVQPHIQPYYNHYIEPTWSKVEPYVQQINSKAVVPLAAVTTGIYNKYGGPTVDKAYKYLDDEWERQAIPQLKKAQKQARGLYDQSFGPYVKTASDAVSPYYTQASKSAQQIYQSQLVPAYTAALPHAQSAWQHGHHITIDLLFPQIRRVAKEIRVFLSRQLWPTVRILYGENVEPQLMRIRERLGRYRDGKKIEKIMQAEGSVASGSTLDAAAASSIAASVAETPYPSSSAAAAASPSTEAEIQEKIELDLKLWQEKFAKAADKGAEDLKERVREIAERQTEKQGQTLGKQYITRLEEVVKKGLHSVQTDIISAVKALPEDASDETIEAAHERTLAHVRKVGSEIRAEAQAIRVWKQTYDRDTEDLVQAALDSTLAVIDNIRELGLQEIGMRWAHMEGVTYKDWSKYHTLKKSFDEWRKEVEGVASSHPGLKKAREIGEQIEDEGMEIAENSAKELSRLKDVSKYKLYSGDASEDFSTHKLPARAAKVAQQVIDKVKGVVNYESVKPTPATASIISSLGSVVAEQASKASEGIDVVVEKASSVIAKSASVAEPILSKVTEVASSYLKKGEEGVQSASSAGSKVLPKDGFDMDRSNEALNDGGVAGAMLDAMGQLNDIFAQMGYGDDGEAEESAEDVADGDDNPSATSAAAIAETTTVADEESSAPIPISAIKPASNEVAASAEAESKGPAALQSERAEQTVAEIVASPPEAEPEAPTPAVSPIPVSKLAEAQDPSSTAVVAELTPADEKEEETDDDFEKVLAELMAGLQNYAAVASSVSAKGAEGLKDQAASLVGSVQSLASGASSVVGSAASSAGTILSAPKFKDGKPAVEQGTALPPSEVASSLLSNGASEAAEAVAQAASSAAEPVRKVLGGVSAGFVAAAEAPILEGLEDDAKSTLNDLNDLAKGEFSRLSEVLAAAVKATPTQGSVESITSAASAQFSGAIAVALSALYGPDDSEDFTRQVQDRYSEAVTAASLAIYGTPTPVLDSLVVQASSKFSQASSRAAAQYTTAKERLADNIGRGKPKPMHEQMKSSIEFAYWAAMSLATSKLSEVTSAAQAKLSPTPRGAYESISSVAKSRLSEALSKADKLYTTNRIAAGAQPFLLHSKFAAAANAEYYQAVGVANDRYSQFIRSASVAVYGTPTPVYESYLSTARESFVAATDAASRFIQSLYEGNPDLEGSVPEIIPEGVVELVVKRYETAMMIASNQFSAASKAASEKFYGTPTGAVEGAVSAASSQANLAASKASENWQSLVAAASKQVYGAPTPIFEVVTDTVGDLASNARSVMLEQYTVMQEIVQELLVGLPPATSSGIMEKLAGAYATGFGLSEIASKASSAVSEGASVAASVAGDGVNAASSAVSNGAAAASSAVSNGAAAASSAVSNGAQSVASAVSSGASAASSAASAQVHPSSDHINMAVGWDEEEANVAVADLVGGLDRLVTAAFAQVYVNRANFHVQTMNLEKYNKRAQSTLSSLFYGTDSTALYSNEYKMVTEKLNEVVQAAKASLRKIGEAGQSGVPVQQAAASSRATNAEAGRVTGAAEQIKNMASKLAAKKDEL